MRSDEIVLLFAESERYFIESKLKFVLNDLCSVWSI